MNQEDIQEFWQEHPCGDSQVGGLTNFGDHQEAFFREYDNFRYTEESYILRCLDRIPFKGRELLEIGLGQGADAEQIVRRGAIWSGIDLTAEAVERVRLRFALRGLSFNQLLQGSALEMPFADNTFDMVYSFGVLHHIPNILQAQSEIARVLKPGGELICMLYAKWSLNFLLSIAVLRRLGLLMLYTGNFNPGGIYGQHLANARRLGLRKYLCMENFIHRNTDGPENPYAKVYDLSLVRQDFPGFHILRAYKRFMHAPPLPVRWLPLDSTLGWHLWVHLTPQK